MAAGVLAASNMSVIGHNDLAGTGDCMHVNVADGHAYIGHMGYTDVGTSIVDVRDPEQPRLVAQIPRPPGTHSHKVQVLGDILLVNHERNRFEDNPPSWSAGLAIYDISRPAEPRRIGFFPTPGVGVHRMAWWEPPYAFVAGTDEGYRGRFLYIVDLTDPSKPKEVGRWWFPGQHAAGGETADWVDSDRAYHLHHALPRGDRLYGGYWDGGLVILDIADPTAPRLVSHLEFDETSRNTHTALPVPGRDLLVVTDEQLTAWIGTQRHVRVIDISDEANPRVVARLPVPPEAEEYHQRKIRCGPHNLHEPKPGTLIDPNVVYLTYFAGGLRAYDISDPANPSEIAFIIPEAPPGREAIQFNDVQVAADGLIYATDRFRGGLYVIRHDRSGGDG